MIKTILIVGGIVLFLALASYLYLNVSRSDSSSSNESVEQAMEADTLTGVAGEQVAATLVELLESGAPAVAAIVKLTNRSARTIEILPAMNLDEVKRDGVIDSEDIAGASSHTGDWDAENKAGDSIGLSARPAIRSDKSQLAQASKSKKPLRMSFVQERPYEPFSVTLLPGKSADFLFEWQSLTDSPTQVTARKELASVYYFTSNGDEMGVEFTAPISR
jgi:hypothetical protein